MPCLDAETWWAGIGVTIAWRWGRRGNRGFRSPPPFCDRTARPPVRGRRAGARSSGRFRDRRQRACDLASRIPAPDPCHALDHRLLHPPRAGDPDVDRGTAQRAGEGFRRGRVAAIPADGAVTLGLTGLELAVWRLFQVRHGSLLTSSENSHQVQPRPPGRRAGRAWTETYYDPEAAAGSVAAQGFH